jgi:hypothetical protein
VTKVAVAEISLKDADAITGLGRERPPGAYDPAVLVDWIRSSWRHAMSSRGVVA